MRILVVDDMPLILEVLCDGLNKPGTEIDRATSCQEAFSLLAENIYDWATLDLSLPDGSGIDILKKIRAKHPNTHVVIISVDAHDPFLKKQLLSMGAEAVFPKPFDLEELIECIYGWKP